MIEGTNIVNIGSYILFVNTIINVIASIITLLILKQLVNKNGYTNLVTCLTISSGLYELSCILFVTDSHIESLILHLFFITSCGLSSSLWMIAISFSSSYIIITRQYFDIDKNFIYIILFAVGIPIALTIAMFLTEHTPGIPINIFYLHLSDRIRFFSIVGLILNSFFTFYYLHRLNISSNKGHPIYILCKRLAIYPIVQIIARVPITWYFYVYGFCPNGFDIDYNFSSYFEIILYYSVNFTLPISGVGNIIVFWIVQKNARSIVFSWFLNCKRKELKNNNEENPLDDEEINDNNYRISEMEDYQEEYRKSVCDEFNGNRNSIAMKDDVDFNNFDEEELVRVIYLISKENKNQIKNESNSNPILIELT